MNFKTLLWVTAGLVGGVIGVVVGDPVVAVAGFVFACGETIAAVVRRHPVGTR